MQLTQDDIKKMEKIGSSDKGEIHHILTKGGLNLIVQKTVGGDLSILSHAPHRGIAIFQAEQVHKNIQWSELAKSEMSEKALNLRKDEAPLDAMGNPIYESTPQKHYDLASHHSKMAGKARNHLHMLESKPDTPEMFNEKHDSRMRNLMHSDIGLRHYEMAGLSHKEALEEHKKHMALHHELQDEKPPFVDYALKLAWQRANPGKDSPRGLGNYSE